ncbi:MAG: TonB-dependent receptor domain-containing protein [Bryobacteraceae bacterium]
MLFSVAICCVLAAIAFAQTDTGSLSGTVSDPNGALIPNSKLRIKNDQTGRELETTTSDAGIYVFPNVTAGPYTLTAEQAGFKKLNRSGVVIAVASRMVLNLQMEVGDVQQTVDVTAEAPLLNTTTTEVGSSFTPKFMKDLPLFSGGIRNPEAFVAYMPGVNNGSGDSSINGGSRRAKEVQIDGASLTIPESGGVVFYFPSAEQFSEFKLLTNSFSAEYGRTGGGIEIFLTKSGTNNLHGGAFYNLRRDHLWGANGYQRNLTTNVRNKVYLNEIGASVGGPVYIPKVYDGRNKTFFFYTYVKDKRPLVVTNALATLATARMRNGDFGEIPLTIYDPNTTTGAGSTAARTPFPNNQIPQGRFSTVSKNILPLIPATTTSGIAANYTTVNTNLLDRDMHSFKVDHAFTEKHRTSFWYSLERWYNVNSTNFQGPLSHALKNDYNKPDYIRVNHDWIMKPNLVLHFTYGYSNTRTGWANLDQQGGASKIGLKGVAYDAFPSIYFRGATCTATCAPATGPDNLLGFANTNGNKTVGSQFNMTNHVTGGLTWLRGRHEFKIGGDFRRTRTYGPVIDQAGAQGEFGFDRAQTGDPLRLTGTGNAFASFLLGLPNFSQVNITLPEFNDSGRFGYHGVYFNDNWKVNSKLTLNLGMRWDLPLARYSPLGVFTSFDPKLTNPKADNLAGGLAYAGFGPGRINAKRFADIDYKEFGPRVGFAYQINSKTVLRAAYGIYYAAGNHTTGGFCLGCSFGFGASPVRQTADGFSGAFAWDGGFQPPPGFVPPPFIDPSFANGQSPWYLGPRSGIQPRVQNWNITIQRELPKGFVLDISYVGHRAYNLNSTVQLNQIAPSRLALGPLLTKNIADPEVVAAGFRRPFASFTGTLAQALRPYPQFLDVPDHYGALGRSWYDGLQTKAEKRFSNLVAFVAYTWSKSLSDGSFTQTAFQEENQDSYNRGKAEKSLLRYDIPHTLNVLASYDLPFGRGQKFLSGSHAVVRRLVGGWTFSWLGQYRSGTLIALSAPNTLGAGVLYTNFKKANTTGQAFGTGLDSGSYDPRDPNNRQVYNRGAFAVPGQFEFGSASRYFDDFRQPKVLNENISIVKRTKIFEHERQPVEFEYRADFFNAFNRTRFGGVVGTLTAPNFGQITGPQLGPRFITMGLRINW